MTMRRLRLLPLLLLLCGFAVQGTPVTIHLAGDSTLAEKLPGKRPETGWGEMLARRFDTTRVRVENHARNGRSTRTFIEEGRWQALVARLRKDDYVFIQFGHNDASKEKTDRYTPPGDYRRNLVRFVREAREKQAIPVLLTPVMRRRFDGGGSFYDAHGEYPDIVRAVAREERVPLIDMHRGSEQVIRRYGAEESKKLFLHLAPGESANYPQGLRDDTHFSPLGAEVMATLAVEGIREARLGLARLLGEARRPASAAPAAPAQESEPLLSPRRIAALPEAERRAWTAYLEESRRLKELNDTAMAAELRQVGRSAWTPAPEGPSFYLDDRMTPEWFRGDSARHMADVIVSFQTPAGGWSKRVSHTGRPRRRGEGYTHEGRSYVGTFDNGATTEQMRFLAGAYAARGDARWRDAFLRGLDYVLRAQFPNGCWPQVFPLQGGYHDAATFNDDAMVRVLRVVREAGDGKHAWVPEPARQRARAAVARGVECILRSQVVVDGARTVWGAQHDPLTLAPVKARAYEHASLSGRESAEVVNFLMSLEAPDPRVASAVHAAAAWFRRTAIRGFEYQPKGGLTAKEGAGPIWARFYEIGTDRPIFSNRDGVVRYAWSELEDERRLGYGWYTDEPATTLRRYERWSRAHPAAAQSAQYTAVVDARHRGREGAAVGGVRTFRTIGAALAAASAGSTNPYVVFVRNGRYREKLTVDKPNVSFIGESRDGTVLTYDAHADTPAPTGGTYGTRGSFTLRITAPGFHAENLTIENGFDYPGNARKAADDPTRARNAQAVALMLDGQSDRAVFRNCTISGHQDTLFPNAGRSYFHRCTVLGSVDFIFGAGVAVFEDSDIVSRDRGSRTNNGYVTAPSTPISRPYGFLFVDCRLKKETPAMAAGSVTLGRPWHPFADPLTHPSAVFVNCWMDDHVGARGWDQMSSVDATGTRRWYRPENARFFEHGTTGPGAVESPSRRVLTDGEVQAYTIARALEGWDPRG